MPGYLGTMEDLHDLDRLLDSAAALRSSGDPEAARTPLVLMSDLGHTGIKAPANTSVAAHLTKSGAWLGTIEYMAPEQFSASRDRQVPAVDVWSP